MYWHQGCVNTATVSIQTEGARVGISRVGIHVWEGANTYFRNNSSIIFSCICASANTGPTCIHTKINSPRSVSCMYWFCAGGKFENSISLYLYLLWNKVMSKGIVICYAAPLWTARNSCVCICNEKLIPKAYSSVSVSAMKCILNSKTCFSVCNAIWTTGSVPRNLWILRTIHQKLLLSTPPATITI